MGQKGSRVVYAAPEHRTRDPVIRKAGSLSTLASHNRLTNKKEKTTTLRRTRSFSEQQELEEQQRQLREKVEKEAQELDEWIRQRPSKHLYQPPKLQDLASLLIARSLRTSIDVERLSCNREIKNQVEYMLSPVFDETIADPSVAFSNSGCTIIYNGKSYTTTVLKTPKGRGIFEGRCGWILYIENSRVQGWIQIGVVDEARWKTKCKTIWDGNPHPFRKGEIARRSNGNFHSGRNATEATMVQESIYVGGYGRGDTIGVKIDFDSKEIIWTKNGETYGSPVSFPHGPILPSVSLDSPGESVSLLYYTCSLRSIGLANHIQHRTVLTQQHGQNGVLRQMTWK